MKNSGTVPTRPSGQHSVPHFGLADMARLCGTLRKIGRSAGSMEETAGRIVGWLYESLVDDAGDRAAVLVRCFKTHAVSEMPSGRDRAARTPALMVGSPPVPRCLALLASAGQRAVWNSRVGASERDVIPLAAGPALFEGPMIAALFGQIGLGEIALSPRNPSRGTFPPGEPFGIVHEPVARGSVALTNARDFVETEGVASVVAIGGPFPGGDAYVLTIFSGVAIGTDTAELFKPLAVSVKLALSEHLAQVFA